VWALEELQLPYNLEMVAFPPKLKQPAYLEVNPIGSVPFMVDGDTRINESGAILEYLSARYDAEGKLTIKPDAAEFGNWLNWIHYGEASLATLLAAVVRYLVFLPKEQRSPAVAEDFKGLFAGRLVALEQTLADGREFLCENRMTMADVSVGYALFLARFLRLEDTLNDQLKAYLDRMVARPAFVAAMEKKA
jgi:glutathione S-transferase